MVSLTKDLDSKSLELQIIQGLVMESARLQQEFSKAQK